MQIPHPSYDMRTLVQRNKSVVLIWSFETCVSSGVEGHHVLRNNVLHNVWVDSLSAIDPFDDQLKVNTRVEFPNGNVGTVYQLTHDQAYRDVLFSIKWFLRTIEECVCCIVELVW